MNDLTFKENVSVKLSVSYLSFLSFLLPFSNLFFSKVTVKLDLSLYTFELETIFCVCDKENATYLLQNK